MNYKVLYNEHGVPKELECTSYTKRIVGKVPEYAFIDDNNDIHIMLESDVMSISKIKKGD